MKVKSTKAGLRGPRKDRMVQEEPGYDTYKSKGKLPDPTVCSRCGALFHKGRWSWEARPAEFHEAVCPACHRIRDKRPAGVIHLSGPFFEGRREEILNAARNQEAAEKKEHPLCRIMEIRASGEGTEISTTDTHLPRRIGEALRHAYQGEVEFHYEKEGFTRVTWKH